MPRAKIMVKMEKNYTDVVGKPVFNKSNRNVIGEVISYDKETGEAVLEIDEQEWQEIANNNMGNIISSRSTENDE